MTDDAPSGDSGTPGATPADGNGLVPSSPPPPAAPTPPSFESDKTVMRPAASATPTPAEPPGSPTPPVSPGPSAPSAPSASPSVAGGAHAAPVPYDATPPGPPSWEDDAILDPDVPTTATKAGLTGGIAALGTGLLGAAVVISTFRSRTTDDGDLDWSNYGAGLAATVGLLGIALLGSLASRRAGGRPREEVITWPGTVGILATAMMIAVGIDKDDNWVGYLIGGVIVALSLIGYVAARRAAFTVTAILGLVLIYGLLFDDLLADNIGSEHQLVIAAAVVATFVLVVTLVGWLLPSRAVTGVVVGAMGVVGFVAIFVVFLITRFLGQFFGAFFYGMGESDASIAPGDPMGMPVDNGFVEADVWWVLAFAGLLTLVWALAAAISNHSGFSILAIAMPAITVPLASVALAAEHPSWWSAIVGGAGGLLLLGGLAIARVRGRSGSDPAPAPTSPYPA